MNQLLNACLLISALAIGTGASAEDATITRTGGYVVLHSQGKLVHVRQGIVVKTPLHIKTGATGALQIQLASANMDIGPNSIIAVPGAESNHREERVQHSSGRALYTVKPRRPKPFTVETPFLVSVVKGTIFSVAVTDDAAEVALLDGALEVRSDQAPEAAMLVPRQVARRASGDSSITVTNVSSVPEASLRPSSPGPLRDSAAPSTVESNALEEAFGDLSEIVAADRSGSGLLEVPPPSEPTPMPTPDVEPTPQPTPEPMPPVEPEPEPTPQPEPEPEPEPQPQPTPEPEDDDDDRDDDNDDDDDDDDDDD